MSDDTLQLILQRLGGIQGRLGGIDHRLDNVDREQTRLRTDMLGPTRADATAAVQRSLQSQFTRLRTRVDRLEGKPGGGWIVLDSHSPSTRPP